MHASPVFATLLMKVSRLPLDVLHQHRMVYRTRVDCTIVVVASHLRNYAMHNGERGEDGKRVRDVLFYEGFGSD